MPCGHKCPCFWGEARAHMHWCIKRSVLEHAVAFGASEDSEGVSRGYTCPTESELWPASKTEAPESAIQEETWGGRGHSSDREDESQGPCQRRDVLGAASLPLLKNSQVLRVKGHRSKGQENMSGLSVERQNACGDSSWALEADPLGLKAVFSLKLCDL